MHNTELIRAEMGKLLEMAQKEAYSATLKRKIDGCVISPSQEVKAIEVRRNNGAIVLSVITEAQTVCVEIGAAHAAFIGCELVTKGLGK